MFRAAFYLIGSREDAEDVVQDMYLKLWDQRDALDTVRNPEAYCITMVKNCCMDRLRKGLRESPELDENIASGSDTASGILGRESLERVYGAMEDLSEGQRTVLRMKVFEGLSYEEISVRTGKSNLTLRVLLSQARRKLKKAI